MSSQILQKIRRLNWVLSETTTGSLSYRELSQILSELIDANVYIFDLENSVLGSAFNVIEDKSTFENEEGSEQVIAEDNRKLLEIRECTANLCGEAVLALFGEGYTMAEKFHTVVPVVCGGARLGTLLLTRYTPPFDDEDLALCEYGATVVGLEIQRNQALEKAKEDQLRLSVNMALSTLSYSEKDAIEKILQELGGQEGAIVASKIAAKYGLTNSVIVNALRKLESAGVLEAKSLGMKGTRIRILNPYLLDEADR